MPSQVEISERKLKAVSYDTQDNFSVLCQMHGSVLPRVTPFCVANVTIALGVWYLRNHKGIDLTFSDKGESFMSILVSFLIVTRSSIAYSRYMEARTYVSDATKAARELIQHAVAFTRYDSSPLAKEWRSEVARRIIVILRTTVAVLEYETTGQHAWKVHELSKSEKLSLLTSVGKSNERSPIMLMLFLRSTLISQRECMEETMHVNKELRLLLFSSQFVTAYHGLMSLITTPFPFPLVQMARTFLFLWVFLLPFCLVDDYRSLVPMLLIIFFITYGFVGLEYVSIELDDPFGEDANDFDIMGLSEVVIDDIYVSIHDVDGKEAATNLKKLFSAFPSEKLSKKKVNQHQRESSIMAYSQSAEEPRSFGRSNLLSERKDVNLIAGLQRRASMRNVGFLESVFSESIEDAEEEKDLKSEEASETSPLMKTC